MRPGNWMNFGSGQLANLGNGNSAQGNVYNALLYQGDTRSEIDNLITGNGNDTVYGNDVFNTITLGNGNDVVNCGGGGSQIVAGDGNDTVNGGAGNETFTLTGGTYTVDGGTGNNILDLTRLTAVNGAPFTIQSNDGTGTVYEGALLRVTFSGITSIEEPGAPATVVGGTAGQSNTAPPAIDVAESSASAGAPAGATGDATSVSASTVNGASSMSFIPADTQVNPADVVGPQQSIVLQQGTPEQISGFDPTSDKLDLTQVLAHSHLSLSDLSQAGTYFTLTDSGGDATLSFYPSGQSAGGGSALATLTGVGHAHQRRRAEVRLAQADARRPGAGSRGPELCCVGHRGLGSETFDFLFDPQLLQLEPDQHVSVGARARVFVCDPHFKVGVALLQ
jgi:hypothetical protein